MTPKILLCDDEVHILNATRFKFSRAGYEVLCAADGQEAWELVQQSPPDVVVTDFQMPRLTGMELAERMHNDPCTRDIPLLMLTAKGFELSAEELRRQYGILSVIHKPFSPRELLQRVEVVLAGALCTDRVETSPTT